MEQQNIGSYQVIEKITESDRAVVYRASDTRSGRIALLKAMLPSSAQDQALLVAFLQEARIAAELDHPNVLRVVDVGEADGIPFVATEHLPTSLEHLIADRGAFPADRALEIVHQAALALDYAHARGVFPLDLNPTNIFLADDGTVKVSAFGGSPPAEVAAPSDDGEAGRVLQYMAPERARGEQVDERADIYSLGAALYQLLSGQLPFPGETSSAVLRRKLYLPDPNLQAARVRMPIEVDRIVSRALSKRPAGRFRTARDMILALERAGARPRIEPPSPPSEEEAAVLTEESPAAKLELVARLVEVLVVVIGESARIEGTPDVETMDRAPLPVPPRVPEAPSPAIRRRPIEVESPPIRTPAGEAAAEPVVVSPRPRQGWLLAVVVLSAVGIVALTLFVLQRGGEDGSKPSEAISASPGAQVSALLSPGQPQRLIALAHDGGKLTVDLPRGAVGADRRLLVRPMGSTEVPPGTVADHVLVRVFDITLATPEGQAVPDSGLRLPAVLSFSYDETDLGMVGGDLRRLGALWFSDGAGAWAALPSKVDQSGRSLVVEVDHFSLFALGVRAPMPTAAPFPTPAATPTPTPTLEPRATLPPTPTRAPAPKPTATAAASPVGLVSRWPGDGNANDVVGGNHGTLQGGATFAPGKVGQAFRFDGTSSVVLNRPPAVSNLGSWTYALWVNVSSFTNGGIGDGDGSYFVDRTAETQNLASLKAVSGQFGFQVRYDNGTGLGGPVGGGISQGEWMHVAMVREFNVGFHLYVNGTLVSTFPDKLGSLTPPVPKLGHHDLASFSGFTGLIDEFTIHNQALSIEEIKAIYDAGSQRTVEPGARRPPAGLVGRWPGDGNAQDIVGGNHGTLSGGVTFPSGKSGQAFSLDGVASHVLIPDSATLNPTNKVTLEGWVYATGRQGAHRDIISKDGETSGRQYLLTISSMDRFRPHVGVPAGFKHFDGAAIVRLNRWYHVAMAYDGSSLNLYVNGVLDGSMNVSGPIIRTTQPVRLGGGAPLGAPPYHFQGLIDEVSIYNRALSAAEIKAIYDAGSTGRVRTKAPRVFAVKPPNEILVINANDDTIVGTIALPSQPNAVTVAPDGSRVYVSLIGTAEGRIAVIDPVTNSVVDEIAVGGTPAGLDLVPDGSKLYVTEYDTGSVFVIDIETLSVLRTIPPVRPKASNIRVHPQGDKAYVSGFLWRSIGNVCVLGSLYSFFLLACSF